MSKKFNDGDLVRDYLITHRLRITAEKFGCSDETVRRALIRNGVPRKGNKSPQRQKKRKYNPPTRDELLMIINDYYNSNLTINDLWKKYGRSQETISHAIKELGHGIKECEANKKKITDEQLIEAAKTMTRQEIADCYGMNICNVDRRIKRLGVKCKYGWTSRGGKWRYRQRTFASGADYDRAVTLKAVYERYNGVCQICGKPTDWNDHSWSKSFGAMYPTIDHKTPLSKGGAHTWDNVQLACALCNSNKRDLITE